ncbi:MAG: hypothetical protein J1G38_04975 [Clostridiales bacterium]|nr:hypothetical protein [Clostridiales bacterium]
MFEPQNDRVDYGKILTPPEGYELDFAVGTTYSLDFDAFIAACMSLGLSEDTDSTLLNNPVFMLHVLHETSGKIALFCESGQIHAPAKVIPLYALLENSVHQVSVKLDKSRYASFHPKFWLISYKNKTGEKKYRLIVLSRNLTFDRSWDVVIALDGDNVSERAEKNRPLKDFLAFLQNYIPTTPEGNSKNKRIQELISELDYVGFKTDDGAFEDFDFIPIGVDGYSIRNYPLFGKEQYYELLVMSPFLSKTTVKELNDRWKKTTVKPALFTRRQSLNEVQGSDNFEVYCMRSEVVDGEDMFGEVDAAQQDIHAKLYMLRQNSAANAELYLGSMNASHNAMYGNVEFLVRLICKSADLTLGKLKNQLFCGDEHGKCNPFEKVDVNTVVTESDGENLDIVIKMLCRSGASARVEQIGEKYNIVLDVPFEHSAYPITVCPLFAKCPQTLKGTMIFENLALNELSRFYRVTVTGKEKPLERIIVIPTDNMPENRDEAVISSIIPDTKSFYAYLAFVLGDNPVLDAIEALRILGSGGSDGRTAGATYSAALYERMLKTAATDPDKLNSVDYIVRAVSKDGIVPDIFLKLYETFQKAVRK